MNGIDTMGWKPVFIAILWGAHTPFSARPHTFTIRIPYPAIKHFHCKGGHSISPAICLLNLHTGFQWLVHDTHFAHHLHASLSSIKKHHSAFRCGNLFPSKEGNFRLCVERFAIFPKFWLDHETCLLIRQISPIFFLTAADNYTKPQGLNTHIAHRRHRWVFDNFSLLVPFHRTQHIWYAAESIFALICLSLYIETPICHLVMFLLSQAVWRHGKREASVVGPIGTQSCKVPPVSKS